MRSLMALLGISITLCGCGYLGSARSWDPASASEGFDLLGGLEPLLQRGEEDCGFAVLAMLLRHHGVGGGESLAAGGGALTARELRDELRSRGFRAYLIQGEIDDLAHEIRRGRPAIVGLVKPGGDRDRPHFEIVAGIHEAGGLIAGVDPARGWTLNSFTGFLKEWEPAGRLLLVAAPGNGPEGRYAARTLEHPELEAFSAGYGWLYLGGGDPTAIIYAPALVLGTAGALPFGLTHALGGRKFMPKETWTSGDKFGNMLYFSAYFLGFPAYTVGYLLGVPCAPSAPPPPPPEPKAPER